MVIIFLTLILSIISFQPRRQLIANTIFSVSMFMIPYFLNIKFLIPKATTFHCFLIFLFILSTRFGFHFLFWSFYQQKILFNSSVVLESLNIFIFVMCFFIVTAKVFPMPSFVLDEDRVYDSNQMVNKKNIFPKIYYSLYLFCPLIILIAYF